MISFIVPSHNYGSLISNCVSSIMKNDKNFIREIIVVNDSSSDHTDEVIKKLKKKYKKIKYFKKNFKNLSKTMNYGILKSTGNIICKIDADDTVTSNFAKKKYKFFLKSKSDFLYSDLVIRDKIKNLQYKKRQVANFFLESLFYPCGSGCLFKKKIWKKVGGYNTNNFYQDDYDFWLRIKKLKGIRISYLNEALYVYNKHETNMSNNLFKRINQIKIFIKNIF